MNFKLFKNNFTGTQNENKFLRIALVGNVALTLVLGVFLGTKDTVVAIVPPTLAENAWVSANEASQTYAESWAYYVANLVGNVTPENAGMVRAAIEPLLDTSIYQDAVNKIEDQVSAIKRERVVLTFEAKGITRERNNPNKFFVEGRATMVGANGKPIRSSATYEVELKIRNYRPIITFLDTYEGKPKTEDVLRRDEKSKDARKRMEKANNENQ
ncbi:conjugal transfer protein [Pseudomonas aeruginosa]|uniref:TraE/TraK family type IV conjugative transfer system protein n=1 Tax=Pseudomonas aeruginosa TaxID=287 RepID=UPI000FFECF8F|nr:TraE/TraK family type IV conjugative transfer system protein [Pseudomonas aeruginosa]MBA5107628.1 pilus assembly protein [Pseudomonas aeruginosa]MBD1300067.1 pilus assembly protein [Pseudomonas aeruginosa]MBD1340632.1 pilus assembly protein [Pseudomonas aeruginosa]MDP5993399.1 TraE/TraK family type IV conjugative transfer system protein [Pseudomonas aeruginosa]RRS17138.1 conjugal transfer protein [Pseudomonas aeruginosa]